MATTLERAVTTADALFAQGLITRYNWRAMLDDGREAVSAWIALGGAENDYRACENLGISGEMARLIPWLEDAGSDAAWRPRMTRLFDLLRRTPVLRAEDWTALDHTWRRLAVEEAARHTTDERALAACRAVAALCARAEAGENVPQEEWEALRAAASDEPRAAAQAAAWAAQADWVVAAVAAAAAVRSEVAADQLATAILDALDARLSAREAADAR